MTEGTVAVRGGRLWFERVGEGYLVVLIHPSPFDARIWDDQVGTLAERHEVVRYDRRGFGRSDVPTAPFSEVRDLRALLGELGIERCALVACGDGSAIAFDLALEAPALVEAVVAVSPRLSGYRWQDPGYEVLRDEVRRAVEAGDLDGAVELGLGVWAPTTVAAHPRVREIARANARALGIAPEMVVEPPPTADRLGELQASTLVLVGDGDIAEVDAIGELIVTRVPGATKRVVAAADQLINVMRAERLNRLVLDFLAYRTLGG